MVSPCHGWWSGCGGRRTPCGFLAAGDEWPHTGKGAKATSTDSPPKGYGTPNLVGSYSVSGRSLGSLVSGSLGLGHGSIGSRDQGLSSRLWATHKAADRPRARSVAEVRIPAYTISPARRAHGGHPMTSILS